MTFLHTKRLGEMYETKIRENLSKKIKDVIKNTFQCIFRNYSMEIRKVYILPRHLFKVKDNSAGIYFTEEDGGVVWFWHVIEETVTSRNLGREEDKPLLGSRKVSYYDGCNWLFLFLSCFLIGSFFLASDWLVI